MPESTSVDTAPAEVVRQILAGIRQMAGMAKRLNLRAYEEERVEVVRKDLVEPSLQLADALTRALHFLGAHYDKRVAEHPSPAADHAFVGRLQVGEERTRLASRLDLTDPLELIAECNRLRGTIVTAADAVDRAVCEEEGWAVAAAAPDVTSALAVRRAYVQLHRALAHREPVDADKVEDALAAAVQLFDDLIAAPIGRTLRMADRCELLRARQRAAEWVVQGTRRRDTQAGLHIWQDLRVATALLLQINNRQELVVYDRQIAFRLARQLGLVKSGALEMSAEDVAALRTLYGRDPHLDGMIELFDEGIAHRLARVAASLSAAHPT